MRAPFDARPLIQIVHTAGLSVRVRPTPARLPGVRALRPARTPDPTAIDALVEFLHRVVVGDSNWRRVPTWWVDTGARTACGDDASLEHARSVMQRIAEAAQAGFRLSLAAPWEDRSPWFAARWPSAPATIRSTRGTTELQLFGIASPGGDDSRVYDAPATDDVRRLEALFAEHRPEPPRTVVRLVAMHGARALAIAGTDGLLRGPADLADAGVATIAGVRSWSADAVGARAVAGTSPWHQRWNLLRVHETSSQPMGVAIETLTVARAHGIGPFRVVRHDSDSAGDWSFLPASSSEFR